MTQQVSPWTEIIKSVDSDFKQLAKSHNKVTWENECEYALQAVSKNTRLMQCNPVTVQESIKNVAAIGLSLNPAQGLAYLVPDSIKVGNQWQSVCQLRISFQGLVKLATDCGSIKLVRAATVRANDTFIFNGLFAEPVHTINSPFNENERGELIGVYCVAMTPDNVVLTEMMSWNEVLNIKAAAKTQNVWNQWTEEMAKKAVIKRASKQWPKTENMSRLEDTVSLLNKNEGSEEIVNGSALAGQIDDLVNLGATFEGVMNSLQADGLEISADDQDYIAESLSKKLYAEQEAKAMDIINWVKSEIQEGRTDLAISTFVTYHPKLQEIAIKKASQKTVGMTKKEFMQLVNEERAEQQANSGDY